MYCGVLLSGVNKTMESGKAVSMTLRSLTQRCQRNHGVWLNGVNDMYCGVLLSGVNETVESYSAVSTKPWSLPQRCQWHVLGSLTQRCQRNHGVWLSVVNGTAESYLAVSTKSWSLTQRCQWHCGVFCTQNQNHLQKYFHVLESWKNRGKKLLDTVPFKKWRAIM